MADRHILRQHYRAIQGDGRKGCEGLERGVNMADAVNMADIAIYFGLVILLAIIFMCKER